MTRAQFDRVREQLESKGVMGFEVATGSMLPLIRPGEPILVHPLRREPEVFEILVFWDGAQLVCHYVWHLNQLPDPEGRRLYVTRALKGGEDLPVPGDRVLGVVASHRLSRWQKLRLVAGALGRRIRRGVF